MYVYMYMYMYMYLYECIYVHGYLSMHLFMYMHIYLYIYMCICKHVYIYIPMISPRNSVRLQPLPPGFQHLPGRSTGTSPAYLGQNIWDNFFERVDT